MTDQSVDVLMITYNRPDYTRLSLSRLLDSCPADARVWVWQNGSDQETMAVVAELRTHPRFFRFHHSPENRRLREPTNWLWENANGGYVSKVDDDCLVPENWIEHLRRAHQDVPTLGVIGCWRFQEEDFSPDLAAWKIRTFPGGHSVLVNVWIEGSGYLMKRACIETKGVLRAKKSFTHYCVDLALAGWVNGWIYPFLRQEHMDDPRAPHTGLRKDSDLVARMPLTAANNGIVTLNEWTDLIRRDALVVQKARIDAPYWRWWRVKLRGLRTRAWRLLGRRAQW
jgi:GT2 family glycosyltransferase